MALVQLYGPIQERLKAAGGTLEKLRFSISRVADAVHSGQTTLKKIYSIVDVRVPLEDVVLLWKKRRKRIKGVLADRECR